MHCVSTVWVSWRLFPETQTLVEMNGQRSATVLLPDFEQQTYFSVVSEEYRQQKCLDGKQLQTNHKSILRCQKNDTTTKFSLHSNHHWCWQKTHEKTAMFPWTKGSRQFDSTVKATQIHRLKLNTLSDATAYVHSVCIPPQLRYLQIKICSLVCLSMKACDAHKIMLLARSFKAQALIHCSWIKTTKTQVTFSIQAKLRASLTKLYANGWALTRFAHAP